MLDPASLFAAFLLGLFSSAHCVGMCGGIMGALSMAIPATAKAKRWLILVSYNAGRISSYVLIGVVAGAMAAQLNALGAAVWLRWVAGLMLILMGLYLADWWRGLVHLEAAGRHLWSYIQPLGKRVMPVNNPVKALILGFVWGWLPCGLVYSALAYAMAQGHAVSAGIVMLAFGLGTLPSVLATGIAAQQLGRWLRKPQLRWPLAISIIVFGVWTIWGGGHHHHHHSSHHHDEQKGHDPGTVRPNDQSIHPLHDSHQPLHHEHGESHHDPSHLSDSHHDHSDARGNGSVHHLDNGSHDEGASSSSEYSSSSHRHHDH